MKKNGFTLIELLAVIIILAFITLIAVPIILNIIKDVKNNASEISIQNYFDAVELAIANENMKSPNFSLDGIYEISKDGKTITNGNKILKINYEGNLKLKIEDEFPKVVIENGEVIQVSNVNIGTGYVKIESGKVIILAKQPINTLIRGESFNSKIKTLANSSESTVWSSDEKIKSIEFLSNGKLPQGYTLKMLKQLNKVDVSANQDESIIAYYDNGSIFIHSYNLISFDKSLYGMFSSLTELINIEFGMIDTTNIETMSYMFSKCENLVSLDLSMFKTSNVTSMHALFEDCYKLQKLDLSNFDTSKVESMCYMFDGCIKIQKLDLSNFDTSNVTDMAYMFFNCYELTKLNISTFDTSNLRDMHDMFGYCKKLSSLDLRSFNTSKVTDMSGLFIGTTILKPIFVGEGWVIGESTITTNMFSNKAKTQSVEELCKPNSTLEWCVIN